jgi:uncharacterized protein YecE (DUF72 family)
LQLITTQLKPGFRNVVEFRHHSWWNEEALVALELANILNVQSDHPKMPEREMDFSNYTYVRLHGILYYSILIMVMIFCIF